MTKTIFKQIIDGEAPAYRVWEDEEHLAFLDIFPMHEGQVLVIPKQEIDYVFDMDEESYLRLLRVSKMIAHAMKRALNAQRIGLVIEGLQVPHVHVRLTPIARGKGIDPKFIHKAEPEQLERLQKLLKEAIEGR
jgi:histidine triad (HIT) family protein